MKKLLLIAFAVFVSVTVCAKQDPNQLRYDSLMLSNNQLVEQVKALTDVMQKVETQNAELQKQLSAAVEQLTKSSQILDSAAMILAKEAAKSSKPTNGEYKIMTVKNGSILQTPEGKTWQIIHYWSDNKYDIYAKQEKDYKVLQSPAFNCYVTLAGKEFSVKDTDKGITGWLNKGVSLKVDIYRTYSQRGTSEDIVVHDPSDTYQILYYEY